MAKKKTVKKVEDKVVMVAPEGCMVQDEATCIRQSKEELVEQMKSDPAVPAEMFGGSSIAEEQLMAKDEGEFAIKGSSATEDATKPNSTDSGTIEGSALESFGETEKPMTHEELVQEYKVLQEVSYQMIEKQYALEWKVFGEEYKGKYRYLQIDKGMFIFGTNQHDLEYLPANSTKEAYAKYIDKDS